MGGGSGEPVSTVLKSEQIIPAPGVVKVAMSPTDTLRWRVSVIAALMGCWVPANGPEKSDTIPLPDVLQRFPIPATLLPTRTSTAVVPDA